MKNNYKNEYARHIEIVNRYEENCDNEEIVERCRAEHEELMKSIESKGQAYAKGYMYFEEMKERENNYIAIDECIFNSNAEKFIAILRECGFTEFVFTSTWSGSMEAMWTFTKCGCKLDGMVEVNGRCRSFSGNEWEKVPGILIRL